MMLFRTQCEIEGCQLKPTHLLVNHERSTAILVCDDHEAVKSADQLSTPFPYPPPVDP